MSPGQRRVPIAVIWAAALFVASAFIIALMSPKDSHAKRALCTAFASIDAAECFAAAIEPGSVARIPGGR